jgi:DNA replication and repair protein RecF
MINSQNSRDTASRGQQKLLVYALNLALIAYMQEKKGLKTLMLLDDLGSELDSEHAKKLLSLLWERFAQVCITTANLDTLPLENYEDVRLFHVKHGEITEVTN